MKGQRNADKHYEDGRKLHDLGKLSNAERAYRKAIKIDPDFVEAHNNLGTVLLDRGRLKEASNAFRKALKLLPDHPMLLNNVGNVLQLQGEHAAALNWFEKAIKKDPNNVEAYGNLGNVLRALDKPDEAVTAYKRALQINPESADIFYNLGVVLVELDEAEEAIHYFNQVLRINPGDINARLGLGNAYSAQGDLNTATAEYHQAIDLDPANVKAYKELGNTLSDHGEIEKSIAAHRKALEINPTYAEAYWALSKNRKFTEYDDDIKAMESLLNDKTVSVDDRTRLGFALGKAYEDLGDYDKSMAFVINATRLKRNSYDYSLAATRKQFAQIKAVFTPDFLASRADVGDPDPTPIFIVGMPRSGTSLVEQILASHPDVHGAGELKELGKVLESTRSKRGGKNDEPIPRELPEMNPEAFADLGRQYLDRIRQLAPESRFITDKMPHNFLRIGFIRMILPNARIIHCTREPMDNCLSIFKTRLKNGHGYADDLTELGQYYRLYLDLMNYWNEILPGFVTEQSYEALVSDPQQQVSRLLLLCDLDWNDACLQFHETRRKVKTASNAQVRRPIYDNSVELWKRYEKQLQPLRVALNG